MPGGSLADDPEGAPPVPTLWQRVLVTLHLRPREDAADEVDKEPLVDRLKTLMLKPAVDEAVGDDADDGPKTVDELRAAVVADDRERLIGLVAGPLAAAIALVISSDLINHANQKHQSVATYHELLLVMLGLSALMVVTAWFRKRLYLSICMAMYGLAVFNLHYWGFGVPFILFGAWLMVRAYRTQRALREATGESLNRAGGRRATPDPRAVTRPPPSKRYTPPSPKPKGTAAKPEKEEQAG